MQRNDNGFVYNKTQSYQQVNIANMMVVYDNNN